MEIGQFSALIPIVIGLVHVVRKAGLQTRFAPLVSVLLGICAVVAITGGSTTSIFSGVVVGLTAAGAYSGVKTTIKG